MTREAVIRQLAQSLARDKNILFAYIYGSFLTRRDARDIDIAVYVKGSGDFWTLTQEIACHLEKELDFRCKIDAHPLNGAMPSFAFEVMRSGQVLFERKTDHRLNWEAHTLSRYQDIKPMLEFHDRRYLSK